MGWRIKAESRLLSRDNGAKYVNWPDRHGELPANPPIAAREWGGRAPPVNSTELAPIEMDQGPAP